MAKNVISDEDMDEIIDFICDKIDIPFISDAVERLLIRALLSTLLTLILRLFKSRNKSK